MNTTTAAYRVLGTTDEVTTCDICGKVELKGTIVLGVLDADGNVEAELYAGSSCGAKAAGRTGRGASAKLADEAEVVTRKTRDAATEARGKMAFYRWDSAPLAAVVDTFRTVHANAMWAPDMTDAEWVAMTETMIARHSAAIAAAKLGL